MDIQVGTRLGACNTGRLPLLTSSQSDHPLAFNPLCRRSEQAPRTCAQPSIRVWIVEADQKERNVFFPGYSPEATQVRHRDDISVPIVLITDLQFFEICLIMHIPAENDRAETEAIGGDGQEFLLRHKLAAENAIHVNAGNFDCSVALEEFWKGFEGDCWASFGVWHVERSMTTALPHKLDAEGC